MRFKITKRRALALGAVAVAIAAGTTTAAMAASATPARPAGCAQLRTWFTATGGPAATAVNTDIDALTIVANAAAWENLAADVTATPGYPAGMTAPPGGPVRAFTADWSAYLNDAMVGAQFQDTATLQLANTTLAQAVADARKCE